ncbi:MAG: hypothetical protein ACFBZ8_07965 [Opitutales bacterium]
MDKPTYHEERTHVLTQFHQLAEQRMKAFWYYIIIGIGLYGGTIGILLRVFSAPQTAPPPEFFLLLSVAHLLIAIMFFLIERRHVALLAEVREAMLWLERNHPGVEGLQPQPRRVFANEQNRRRLHARNTSGLQWRPTIETWLYRSARLGLVFASALVFQMIFSFGLCAYVILGYYPAGD